MWGLSRRRLYKYRELEVEEKDAQDTNTCRLLKCIEQFNRFKDLHKHSYRFLMRFREDGLKPDHM